MIIPAKEQTSAAVAQHYDDLDPFYRELWGDHVHHGLWTTGLENPAQAVENLIACGARRLELDPGQHVCDVGCGYGATAQWLAERPGALTILSRSRAPSIWRTNSISSTRPIGRSGPADAWRSAPGSPGVIGMRSE